MFLINKCSSCHMMLRAAWSSQVYLECMCLHRRGLCVHTQSETHESTSPQTFSGAFRKHISMWHVFFFFKKTGSATTIQRIRQKSNKITTSLVKPSGKREHCRLFYKAVDMFKLGNFMFSQFKLRHSSWRWQKSWILSHQTYEQGQLQSRRLRPWSPSTVALLAFTVAPKRFI